MNTNVHMTAPLGELITAAFDGAALYSTDPREVSHLATAAVMNLLDRVHGRQSVQELKRALRSRGSRRR